MSNGWKESAAAWIADMGDRGDYGREFVLDRPMLARVADANVKCALDVGCGEGRFCRMLRARGLDTIGIDPTEEMIAQARKRDPKGDYRIGRGEALNFPDGAFDLIVSYLTLVDIPDIGRAICEMARVLRPGGRLLIANLTSFNTAGMPSGWTRVGDDEPRYLIDHYLDERAVWLSWRGIRIENWHRPLSTCMALLLAQGLELRYFAEPSPEGGDPARAAKYRRVPYFFVMEWQKPGVCAERAGA